MSHAHVFKPCTSKCLKSTVSGFILPALFHFGGQVFPLLPYHPKNLFTCSNSIKTRKHKLKLRRTHMLSNMWLITCKSYVIAYQTLQEDRLLEMRFTNATSHNAFLVEVNFLFTI